MSGLNYLRRLPRVVLIRVRDLSACDENMLPLSTTALSSLSFHITVTVGAHVITHDQHCSHLLNWLTCSKGLKRLLLLHCGTLPLGGSGRMIDVESPSKIVLSLLPAWWQSRQLMVLSGTRHVLVQQCPIRLQNRKTARGCINGAKERKRQPAFFQLSFIIQINKMRLRALFSNLHSLCVLQCPPLNLCFLGGNSF